MRFIGSQRGVVLDYHNLLLSELGDVVVEHIGSGIRRIRNLCREYGVAEPLIEVSEHWFSVTFPRSGVTIENGQPDQIPHVTPHDEAHEAYDDLTDIEKMILDRCRVGPQSAAELRLAAGYSSRSGNFKRSQEKLLAAGFIEMTFPERPRSKNQCYRLTERGFDLLKTMTESK